MTRRATSVPACVALALALASCGGGGDAGDGAQSADAPLAEDARIAWLLGPCGKSEHYDRDTSRMLPLLVGKLAVGQPEPVRRAKEALVDYGAAAVPELARLVNRHFSEGDGHAFVQGALEVLVGIADESAREPVLRCLDHPSGSLRLLALRALREHHARPSDYDGLRDRLDVEVSEVRRAAGLALHAADPLRAETEYLEWLRDEAYVGMWPHVLPLLARTEHAETVATCRELVEQVPVAARAWLAAAAAVRGDATALEVLRAELREDDVARRTTAVKALLAVELPRELAPVLLDDPDPSLRALAAAGIASLAPDEETHEWLSRGLDDPSDPVRVACIGALLDRGDAAATDRVLFLLDAQQPLFQLAFDLLRRTPENPLPADLARRAFERLVARDAAESHLPVASRQPLYQAIGVLPLADAARWLRERGLALDEPLGGLRAHRWMTMQASNGGPAGRAWLAAELAGERDPLRRIDLLWAVSTHSDDLARETLLARVEDPDVDPYELLFVADRLANVGPPSLVAPLLKRVTLRVQQDDVRAALQCLLWRWY